jgi:Flp pilus assembly protein TadG
MTHPGHHPSPGLTCADERGVSLSAFVATIVVALLAMGGLVIDGGAQSTASRECQQVASEAARAASDSASPKRASGGEGDLATMEAAAQAVIDTHSGVAGTTKTSDRKIVVTTTKTVPTTFLSLIGIATLSASGEATIDLLGTR